MDDNEYQRVVEELKQLQEDYDQLNMMFENMGQGYEEALMLYDRAVESSRMKSDFIQQISHEIRTPLNILSGFTQILTTPGMELDEATKREVTQGITDNLSVMCRFTTADNGRKASLLVDGKKIASITIPSNVQGAVNGFYNIEYPIPAELATNNGVAKEKFVVRLSANAGTINPGLYYMRLLKGENAQPAGILHPSLFLRPFGSKRPLVERTLHPSPFYNIQGQRVTTPTKGVYINNGKKIMK